jgi:hypothetical protein
MIASDPRDVCSSLGCKLPYGLLDSLVGAVVTGVYMGGRFATEGEFTV